MTQAKTSRNNVMINPDDAVMLLIDHQSGLFQLVKDIPVPELRRNAIALAKVVTLLKIPVITTASVPDGPNGPLIPDIHQAAPHAQYVARQGQIQCLGYADVCPGDRSDRSQNADHRRHAHQRVPGLPLHQRSGRRLEGVWRRGRLGQLEQDGH